MTSGGNSFNYFPENQLTKFIAVPQISITQRASFPQDGRPCVWARYLKNMRALRILSECWQFTLLALNY